MADNSKTSGKADSKGEGKEGFSQSLSSKIGEYKGEFKRIVWPSKEVLFKNTYNSIVICIVFGIIIFALDMVFNYGMTVFAGLVG